MTTTPVQLYILDAAFTDRSVPAPPFFRTPGGIAQLSGRGLSYFATPYQVIDPREASARSVNWAPETQASILIDQSVYGDFVATLTLAPNAVNAALFGILDVLAFNYKANASVGALESIITGDPTLSSYYQPNTLTISPTIVTGTAYADNGTETQVLAPNRVSFVLLVPAGSITLSYAITAWVENNAFLAGYPNSAITGVIPPTDYNNLLNQAFQAAGTLLSEDARIAALNQPRIDQVIRTAEPSGYAAYVAKVTDGVNTLSMTFGLLYIGQVPTFAAMRTAIRLACEGSGFGTPDQWKARIPELYVESRIYLIPIWDQTIATGAGTLYGGISSPAAILAKATAALGTLPASNLVATNSEFLQAAWDLIPIIAVPDSTQQPVDSLEALFPTYQAYPSTDPNFLYMAADAQAFATQLNTALPVASGSVTNNPSFPIINDGGVQYVSFTQNLTEFCLLTRAYYGQTLGVNT